MLQFSSSTPCIIPTERNEDVFERYLKAYNEYKHSFNESLWTTKSYLKAFGIHMITQTEPLEDHILCNNYIVDLLNNPNQKELTMQSNLYPGTNVNPKDLMILYALSQLYSCQIFYFSTRSKPMIICPSNNGPSRDVYTLAVLQHRDSYLQKAQWFSLRVNIDQPIAMASDELPSDNNLVAAKRDEGQKKPRAEQGNLGPEHDPIIENEIKAAAHFKFMVKYQEFLKKYGASPSDKALSDFKQELSTESITLPNGTISLAKKNLESILQNQGVKIPDAARWVHRKKDTMVNKGKLGLHSLIASFQPPNQEPEQKPVTGEGSNNKEDSEALEQEQAIREECENQTTFRTVSRSLKRVINPKFDYGVLKQRLENLQDICDSGVKKLSEAVGILVNLTVAGAFETQGTTFDYKSIDFGNLGIGADEPGIVVISQETSKLLQKKFSSPGFWSILSTCIGRKNADKKNDP